MADADMIDAAFASEEQVADLTSALEQARAELTRSEVEHESALNELHLQLSSSDDARRLGEEKLAKAEAEAGAKEGVVASLREEVARLKGASEESTGRDGQSKVRLAELEKEKRDLMNVIEEEQADKEEVQADLNGARETLKAQSASLRELEKQLASQSESERSARLRLQQLTLELELANTSRKFFEGELEKGRTAWQGARTDSHNEQVRLQAELERQEAEREAATQAADTLRDSNQSLQARLTDSLGRVKDLTGQLAESGASFRAEIETQKRLVDAMEARESERCRRMEEIEHEWEQRKADLVSREDDAREVVERERRRGDELERRLNEMRQVTERMASSANEDGLVLRTPGDRASTPGAAAPTPSSPFGRLGMMMLSPAAALASRMQKSGMSITEVYGQLVVCQDELAKERAEVVRLSESLAQILAEIEDRAPVLKEQRAEYDRIRLECDTLTSQLTRVMEAQAASERRAEAYRLDADGSAREATAANEQLHDLSRQIRVLTRELALREDPGIAGRSAGDMMDEDDVDVRVDIDDPEDVMQAHLVTFRSVAELQSKNQQLIKIARGLAQQLNADHEARAEDEAREANEAVAEAHELILQLKDERDTLSVRVEALSRERDMFRRMLGGQLPGNGHGHGTGPGVNGSPAGTGQEERGPGGGAAAAAAAARSLAEVQGQFEAYKVEIGADSKRIREELSATRHQLSQAQTALARANATIDYNTERYRMLQDSSDMQLEQSTAATNRTIKLQEEIARGEILLHSANERISEWQGKYNVAKHQLEIMTAEKDVWRESEARLMADNASKTRERDSVQDVLARMQSMQAELELARDDSRRRLEQQVARLEAQAQDLKERVKTETDNGRQATLQRDVEGRDYQIKLERLTSEFATAREQLSAASTARDHLESAKQDLSRQLSAAQEKLAIYEGRTRGEAGRVDDPSLSREQQLELQLADVRAELRAAQDELERAKGHVTQFKAIAQTAEDALASLTSTSDEYRASQESAYQAKEAELASLQERLHKVSEDLTTANTANDDLHRQLETQRTEFEQSREALDIRMTDLLGVEQRAQATQADLRRQIASHSHREKASHEKYLAEVKNHGDTVNELKAAKETLQNHKTTLRTVRNEADVAKTNLEASKRSYEEMLATATKEKEELQKRSADLTEQNNLLHEHLQQVQTQATSIQQAVAGAGGEGEDGDIEDGDLSARIEGDSLEQLRGVIRYLRKNQEIAQRQVDVAKLETARLQQQLQHATRTLDEARVELNNERDRARQSGGLSADHAHLLEQVNSLNVIRESNATLREESHKSERRARVLDERLRETQARVQPLESKVAELEATVHQLDQEKTILNEDNDRWKLRNQQILEKYDRVDPAEVQSLKDQVAQLTAVAAEATQNAAAEAAAATQKASEAIAEADARLAGERETRAAEHAAASDRFKTLQMQTRQLRDRLTKETNDVRAEAATHLEAAKAAQAAQAAAEAKAQEAEKNSAARAADAETGSSAELQKAREEKAEADRKLAAAEADQARLQTVTKELESLQAELETLRKRNEALTSENTAGVEAQEKLKELEAKVAEGNKDAIVAEVAKRQADAEAIPQEEIDKLVQAKLDENAAAVEAAVQKATAELRAEFETAKAEAVSAAEASGKESAAAVGVSDEQVAAQVAEAEIRVKEAAHKAAAEVEEKHKAELEAAVQKARDEARSEAKPLLEEGQVDPTSEAAVQEAVKKAVDEALAQKATETKTEIDQAVKRVTAEFTAKANAQKNRLEKVSKELAERKAELAAAKGEATDSAATPDAGSSAAEAGTSTQPPATAGRGRGRGAGRGGLAGRRGGAAALPQEGRMDGAAAAKPAGLSIKGRAIASALMDAGAGAKRAREDDDSTSDAAKRAKGAGTPR